MSMSKPLDKAVHDVKSIYCYTSAHHWSKQNHTLWNILPDCISKWHTSSIFLVHAWHNFLCVAFMVSWESLMKLLKGSFTALELLLWWHETISVEQSSCWSTETRDDSAHFQETTEGLSVPHLICWQTEGTFTTTQRCCGVFVILAPDIKLHTYLLTGTWHTAPASNACHKCQTYIQKQ